MQSMNYLYKYKWFFTNFLFIFFPFSLILGSFAVNLNIFLLIIIFTLFFFKDLFNFKFNYYDKIILFFFCYTILVFLINYIEYDLKEIIFPKIITIKTFFYLRFLLLYLIIRILINKNILQIKWFIFSCAFFSVLVCFDIFFQYSFGKNIIGLEPVSSRHFSGLFGQELIAGGYIQKLFIFIFFIPIILNLNDKFKFYISILIFLIICFGIILSGNRMPLVLSMIIFFGYLLINKNLRIKIIKTTFLLSIFFFLIFLSNPTFKMNIINFYKDGVNLFITTFTKDISNEPIEFSRPYVNEFYCGKEIFKLNPIFGGGIKSYRTQIEGCSTHPHNYYLELLSDTGICGLLIILFCIYKILIKIIFNFNFFYKKNIYIFPFLLVILSEFFPIRSSGSFFTTHNSLIFFLFLAIIVSLILKKNFKI